MKKRFEDIALLQYSRYVEENNKEFEKIAIRKKFHEDSIIKKSKLMVKRILRVLGIKFDMQLEMFSREEDIRQTLEDMCVYMSLKSHQKIDTERIEKLPLISVENVENTTSVYIQKKNYEELIKEEKSYLALMVESLDVGGLEEVVKLLALEYKKRNLDLKIFCTRKGGKIAEELQQDGVEVIIFGRRKRNFEKYIRKNRPFLINSHYVVDFMDVIAKYQIPVVEVIHNMYVFLPEHRMKKEQQKAMVVSQYIAVSKAAADVFGNKVIQIEPEKMHVIGNTGRKVDNITIGRNKMREMYSIPQDAFVFLVAGTIDARKNQIGIVRAWNILTRLTNRKLALILAGTCNGNDYEKKIRRYIEEWELQDSVYILGYCDKISALMNASDVLIINSYYEGWSMAATEALYSGMPLIHSNCGSGMELVAGGKNGILISNPLNDIRKYTPVELEICMHTGKCENVQELVVAMLTLLQENVYKRENIRNYAKEEFAVDKMINAYLEVYCKAL